MLTQMSGCASSCEGHMFQKEETNSINDNVKRFKHVLLFKYCQLMARRHQRRTKPFHLGNVNKMFGRPSIA